MAKMIYATNTSLDGYIEDENGKFDWAEPDDEFHGFINDLERPVGTYLYGRRLYDTMVYWETGDGLDETPVTRDFAEIWRAAEKIVYSKTLEAVSSARTRLERAFDPTRVRELKATATDDITIGGADLARHAIGAGLVDEYQVFIHPIALGGGKPALPTGTRVGLALLDERRFGSGVVYLRYRVEA